MSINSASVTGQNDPPTTIISHPLHFLSLLASLAGAVISPCAHADNVIQIARQHIENWNQTLRSGNIDDILELYDSRQPMLLQPDGKVAINAVDIGRFWRLLLAKGDTQFRFNLLDVHKQEGMIIARVALSHTGLPQQTAFSEDHAGILIYCVITQQQNGQWKTQIQKWN